MELSFTLVQDKALQAFQRFVVPLATDALAQATEAERHRRISEAIAGLGLATDGRPWIWLKEALQLHGEDILPRAKVATYFLGSSYAFQHGVEAVHQQCGSFDVHAWLLLESTGCPWIVPRRSEPRAVEFRSAHFRRFCWLSSREAAAVRVVTPFAELRQAARQRGDAPSYPTHMVDGYIDRCIAQCEELLRLLAPGQRVGVGAITEVNNSDWDFE